MWLIVHTSSWFIALFDVVVKLLGLSMTIFVVTPKGLEEEENGDEGEFKFDSFAFSIIPTTILLLNLVGLAWNTISIMGNVGEIKESLFANYLFG